MVLIYEFHQPNRSRLMNSLFLYSPIIMLMWRNREMKKVDVPMLSLFLVVLLAATTFEPISSLPSTIPAFLWSPHHRHGYAAWLFVFLYLICDIFCVSTHFKWTINTSQHIYIKIVGIFLFVVGSIVFLTFWPFLKLLFGKFSSGYLNCSSWICQLKVWNLPLEWYGGSYKSSIACKINVHIILQAVWHNLHSINST